MAQHLYRFSKSPLSGTLILCDKMYSGFPTLNKQKTPGQSPDCNLRFGQYRNPRRGGLLPGPCKQGLSAFTYSYAGTLEGASAGALLGASAILYSYAGTLEGASAIRTLDLGVTFP